MLDMIDIKQGWLNGQQEKSNDFFCRNYNALIVIVCFSIIQHNRLNKKSLKETKQKYL